MIPVAGWFAAERADPADPTATPEQVLHGMWFGDRVLWVAPDATPATITALQQMTAEHPEWNATVRIWPRDRMDKMTGGVFAAAAWGVTQTCQIPDVEVVDALFASAAPAPGADGTPPPLAIDTSAE